MEQLDKGININISIEETPALEPVAETHEGSCIMIPVLPNDSLVQVQTTLAARYPEINLTDPDSFHVTLLYMPESDGFTPDTSLYSPFIIRAEKLDVFDTPNGWAIVARVEMNDDLFSLQAGLHDVARDLGLSLSNYSAPSEYQPHITLGYLQSETMPDVSSIDFYYSTIVDSLLFSDRSGQETYIDFIEGEKSFFANIRQKVANWLNPFALIFEGESGFKTFGDNYWIAYYTNSFLDRDDEHFSLKSIQADVDYMNKTGDYPELWRYHVPGTRHGKAFAVFMAGRYAVALGTFDNTPIAQRMKLFYKQVKRQSLSHGFLYFKKVKNVYEDYHSFEITTLPFGVEANPYTLYGLIKEGITVTPTEKAMEDVRAILGDDLFKQVLANGEKATQELEAKGVAFKATRPDSDEDMDKEKEEKKETTITLDLAPITDVMSKMADALVNISEKVTALDSEVKTLKAEKHQAEEKQANEPLLDERRKAALEADMKDGMDAKSIDLRSLPPAYALMYEFTKNSGKR